MLGAVNRLGEVTERIRALDTVPDVLFVDMPPSRNAGFLDILRACDFVIVPTQLERHSIEGVTLMARTAQVLRGEGQGPRLMGIVPNLTDIRTVLHRMEMAQLQEVFGATVWPALPGTIKVPEVAAVGSTLFKEYPDEKVTRKMQAVVNRMMEVLNGVEGFKRAAAVRRATR